ncbi:serine protease [Reticulibacter mediterranei]|uniref:Serine protease n=1 Tax=Reticulibacter mediterranei TaxID=2778369 RepID=A0A8J3N123_9CHLR|nr:nodulation protein NfeD [Reticulibacter mediterranei]GHO90887.1 serine protease [Reticulibacter mediterranei]
MMNSFPLYKYTKNNYTKNIPGWLYIIAIVVGLLVLTQDARPVQAASPHVDLVTLNSEIDSASLRLLTRAIDSAGHDGAQSLVVEVNSPGGDLDSMYAMVQRELTSNVPIIAYVAPSGGHAASAASFITLAAHVAAMAPTTRIGAASPVDSSGGDIGNTLKSKIENDLVAALTSMQNRYHRNVPLAVKMVTEAKSYDDSAAVQNKIVDLGAPTLSALLQAIDGRTITLNSGRQVTLQTVSVQVQEINATVLDSMYAFLLDPNVVFLLFVVAMLGIYLEISHPGVILPGVVGSISLLLFLFAAGSLAPNWAGLALMVLAFALLVLDVQLPAHGVLTIGGVIALILGALLFFNSGGPYDGPKINPIVVYSAAGIVGLIGFTLVTFLLRAQHRRAATGAEGMIGAKVIALTPLVPEGRVGYYGEDWAAVLDAPTTSVDAGSALIITGVNGLRLHVRPVRTQLMTDTHPPSSLKEG